jgi:hypothetical protein
VHLPLETSYDSLVDEPQNQLSILIMMQATQLQAAFLQQPLNTSHAVVHDIFLTITFKEC